MQPGGLQSRLQDPDDRVDRIAIGGTILDRVVDVEVELERSGGAYRVDTGQASRLGDPRQLARAAVDDRVARQQLVHRGQ